MNLGPAELLILLSIVLLLFGSAKLPKLARSVGQAQREFKDGLAHHATDDRPPTGGEPDRVAPSGSSPEAT